MNFNQLKYIIAIDKLKNFTRAAENCNIAQSTLSKEVQRLELEFNVIIFDRSRIPVVPTHKGQDLIKLAHEILHKINQFDIVARKNDTIPEGNFTLGILSCLAPYILPFFIDKLSKKYPNIHLTIIELENNEMEKMLSNNELDGVIAMNTFKKDGYYESILFEEELVLYTNPEHYLYSQDNISFKNIPFSEIKLHKDFKSLFIQKSNNSIEYKFLSEIKQTQFQKGSLETIRKIIDYNGGVTLLPNLIRHLLPEYKLSRIKKINHPLMKQQISFISPRFFQKEDIIKVIRYEIIKNIP